MVLYTRTIAGHKTGQALPCQRENPCQFTSMTGYASLGSDPEHRVCRPQRDAALPLAPEPGSALGQQPLPGPALPPAGRAASYENTLREQLQKQLRRGKVELRASLERTGSLPDQLQVPGALLLQKLASAQTPSAPGCPMPPR